MVVESEGQHYQSSPASNCGRAVAASVRAVEADRSAGLAAALRGPGVGVERIVVEGGALVELVEAHVALRAVGIADFQHDVLPLVVGAATTRRGCLRL